MALQALSFFAIYFLALFILGIFGFGSAMPAVLGSAWALPPRDAVWLALLTSVYSQVQLLAQGFHDANWKVAKLILAGSIVSVIIGVWIFVSLSTGWLTIALGVVLSATVLTDISRLAERLASRLWLDGLRVAFSLVWLAGLISGVAGAGRNRRQAGASLQTPFAIRPMLAAIASNQACCGLAV